MCRLAGYYIFIAGSKYLGLLKYLGRLQGGTICYVYVCVFLSLGVMWAFLCILRYNVNGVLYRCLEHTSKTCKYSILQYLAV